MPTIENVLDDKIHWYKDAIIYELHIKAFRDGNGDGIGDFEGLLGKLDYLQDLGVTAIWVLPFYPSPLRDDGYDIADYYNINPSYGKVKDFQHFLMEAHSRNLKVITELVINHTSDQHPWFQRARRAPKGSPERDFYVWTDDPNQFKDVRIIFQDFESSNWTWDAEAGQYYWHRFFHHQPDLNFDNPLVQEEVFKILDYWCTMGVDGFRLDAVPYLFEREGTNGENLPETHDYLKKLRKHVDENFPGTLLLAEANMWPEDSASYFGDGDECQMNYHFPVMPRMFMALQMEDRYPITDIFDQTPEIPETCQWAIFLRNHDELTLEMVTDEERDYMYKVYAKDPKAKINLGIRHRLAPLMENSRRKIELLNCLLFSLRGTPVIYYGDEIGMGDNFYLGDRDGVRTPMQWSPDRNGGFSQANPQKLYLPVILDPEYHYESVNVETQGRNPSSLLWFMKQMIHMRKKYKAFSRGEMKFISVENPKVLAFIRSYQDQHILVVVNLSRYSQAAELNLGEFKGYLPVEVFSRNKFPAIKEDSPYFFTLGAHAYHWFILKKVNPDADVIPVPVFTLGKWKDLTKTLVVNELENNILPAYLLKSKWFEGKNRIMHGVRITDLVVLPDTEPEVYMMLIEVSYESGFPEMYQLPLTYVHEANAEKIQSEFPQSVISKMHMEDGDALLCDAFYFQSFHRTMLKKISENETVPLKTADIRFYGTKNFIEGIGEPAEIKTRLILEDEVNASISFDTSWFLKLYRKVDRAINPDLEISKFLSEETSFESIPRFAGAIEWEFQNGSIVLGMMQELVEYHGDGWSYMKERIINYNERLLSMDKDSLPQFKLEGSLASPVAFENIPPELQELFGGPIAESTRLLGERTADMHLALASVKNNVNFQPEDFSLHYQRSLFAGLQSLVRTTYHGKLEFLNNVPDDIRPEIDAVLSMKDDLLNHLKRIHLKKFDVIKIRHHGNFHLGQVLFSGKDIMIRDFGGDPNRSYSERRLKRSPLRDLAFMIRSFHYAAYRGLMLNQVRQEDLQVVKPYAAVWTHYVSGFYMHHYYEKVKKSPFIPDDKDDLLVMLETYLLEKAIYDFDYELRNRPEWAIVPAGIILSIVKKNADLSK